MVAVIQNFLLKNYKYFSNGFHLNLYLIPILLYILKMLHLQYVLLFLYYLYYFYDKDFINIFY